MHAHNQSHSNTFVQTHTTHARTHARTHVRTHAQIQCSKTVNSTNGISPPRMPQTTFEPVVPLEETSGEEPCDDDDIDCNDQSSGSDKLPERPVNKPQPTDDSIYFDTHTLTEKVPRRNHTGTGDQEWSSDDKTSTRRPRTTPEPLVIRENMTVAPPRKPLHRITTRAPVGQQTTPSKGGGHGYVTEVDPEPKRSSPQDRLKMNIGLIAGIAAGVILLLLLLAFALYKYKSRDEGTYKVDEGKNYGYEVCASGTAGSNSDTNGTTKCGGGMTPPSGKRKKKDVKEWYV